MVKYKDGKIHMESLEVGDIIDSDVLQKFLDNFALGMNCAAVSVDREGKEVTRPSYYRNFCEGFIHKSSLGDSRCAECHNRMGEEAVKNGKPFVGPCHAGLIDFAAPIMVNGYHLGTVLGGQILDKEPDYDHIRKIAPELGINVDDLSAAAGKIDIVAKRNIEAAAEVLFVVVNSLAESGYRNLEIAYQSNTLADNFMQISQAVESISSSAVEITNGQYELEKEIRGVGELTEEIKKIMSAVKGIANKTKMIGLNASIEAARLGEMGRSFAVVAREIQHLSDSTAETTTQVTLLNQNIEQSLETTLTNSKKTLEITENQSAATEELFATVQDSVKLAEEIKTLFS